MPAANKNEKQVMDVSKPGKAAPTSTAKPVIVGHKPMVQDPMVTAETDPEAKATETEEKVVVSSPAASKKVIAPLSEESKPEPAEAETEEAPKEEPVEEAAPNDSEESAVVDAVIDQVGDKKDANLEPNEEDRKKQEQIEKLIAEKKYFVPLGKVNGKSSTNVLIITLLLFVIFLGLIAAIDAEMIDAGFDLPFDIL